MSKHTERGPGDPTYFIRFGVVALLLVSTTLVLVLVVLPQRYVLSSGFVESGLSFPNAELPFFPTDPVQIAAHPMPTPEASSDTVPDEVVRGPAEIFWDAVLPLLEAGRYEEALPHFERHLLDHPDDRDVRTELARTLIAAGRSDAAVPVLETLLQEADHPAVRLMLARTLRDLGRMDAASAHYDALLGARPDDESLALEWARALAWHERYEEAERVLRAGLERAPGSVPLRVELARVYYHSGRLIEARTILDTLTDAELAPLDALGLRDAVSRALTVPDHEDVEQPPPTLLEQALRAREADDFDTARTLFERALLERPNDPEVWLAYADFLEYELGDLAGAREALLEVERLTPPDAHLQFRLASLEIWTGRSSAAMARLESLLAMLEADDAQPATREGDPTPVTKAEVLALMGDLHRWDGQRVEAGNRYVRALEEDPRNERAGDGVAAIRDEVARSIDEIEDPSMGSRTYGLGDTDDFGRVDISGEWIGIEDAWVWSGAAGSRWISGRDLTAGSASHQGLFVEASPARWWRWGTIRTGLHLGAESVRPGDTDVSYGASVQYRNLRGGVFNAEYRREPAYTLTATLQSVDADIVQDRLEVSLDQALDERWNLTAQADVAELEARAVPGAERSRRTQGALAVGRRMSESWTVGLTTQAMTYSEPAPVAGDLRLFWDPESVYALGPYAQLRRSLGDEWQASLRLSPGLAWINERTPAGHEAVPQLSADLDLTYDGGRWRSAIGVFYSQARLEGYRAYGVRVSFGTSSWLSDRPDR